MKIEHDEHTIEVTTVHAASSYGKPVVIVDGELSDYRYEEQAIPNVPDKRTHDPIEHDVLIDGEHAMARQWATRDGIYLSLGFFGVLGTIIMPRKN